MRRTLSLVAGAATAGAGAIILGEYQLDGVTPLIAGVLFGLIVAEVVAAVGLRRDTTAAAACGAFAAAGMVWGAWISAGEDWSYVPGGVWVGVALAAVAPLLWLRTPGRRAAGSRRGP